MTVLGYSLALVIGLSLGLLGGGGSILTVPVLVYVLGLDMKQAVPMSLAVVGITSVFGAASHQRAGNIRWDAALSFGAAAVVGAYLGGRLAGSVPGRLQLQIFAVLMLLAAISMYFGPRLWGRDGSAGVPTAPPAKRPWPIIALLGGAVGALTGLVGVGGGFMYVPALVLLGGLEMKSAIGTSLVLIVVSCLSGLVSHMHRIELDWSSVTWFSALAVAGVLIGSRLSRRVSQQMLRKGFAVFLLVMGVLVFLRPR